MKYKDAEELAKKLSLENPDECFYMNWLEDLEYYVDDRPEFDNQCYYLNGKLCYDMENGYTYDYYF